MKNRKTFYFISSLLVSAFFVSLLPLTNLSTIAHDDGCPDGQVRCVFCGNCATPGDHDDCPKLNDDDDDDGPLDGVINVAVALGGGIAGAVKAGWDLLWSYEDEMIDWYISPYTEATDETPNCDYCKKGCSSCGSSSGETYYWSCGKCSYSESTLDYDTYMSRQNNPCPACGR